MNMLHDDCLMDLECDECKKEFCDHCQITCDFNYNDDRYERNCYHAEKRCPHCIKKYNVKYEGHCSNNHCSDCYYTDETYEKEREEQINTCDNCLYNFNYCFDCNIIFCPNTTKHTLHKHYTFLDMHQNKKLFEQFKLNNKETTQIPEKNVNIRYNIIDMICDDIYNIDKYMIKYNYHITDKDISYGAILHEMVKYDNDKLKWFIEYLKNKQQDVKTIINTSVMGKYQKEHKQPPIVNVYNLDNLKYLVELGGDIHAVGDIDKCNILYQCIYKYMYGYYNNVVKTIHYLIKNGANVNKAEPINLITSRSQLHKNPERQEILKLLIDNGAIVTDKHKKSQPDFFANN